MFPVSRIFPHIPPDKTILPDKDGDQRPVALRDTPLVPFRACLLGGLNQEQSSFFAVTFQLSRFLLLSSKTGDEKG